KESANGDTASTARTLAVTVNAVADAPTLATSSTSGDEDTAIPLSVSTSLVDADGSESLSLSVGGIPAGATLSDGTHSFTATDESTTADITGWDLSKLTFTPPQDANGSYDLTVTATSTETANGDHASTSRTLTVTVNPVND